MGSLVKVNYSIGAYIYPGRIAGFFFAGVSIYLTRAPEPVLADFAIWLSLLIFIFYPHIAFAHFIFKQSRDTEIRNLLIDMLLIGLIANLLYFNPILALPFAIANSATNYAMRGVLSVFKGIAAFLVGALLASLILGFEFRSSVGLLETIPGFIYLTFATHYIGYVSYNRGLRLIKAKLKAEDLANQDGLTNIHNRRFFDNKLAEEWQRSLRENKPLSLIHLDIDHFKAYNDRYGHPAGDDCLQKVAQKIVELVSRPGDMVARTGGEEFAIILPGSDSEGAHSVAQRVLDGVKSLQIEHLGSKTEPIVTLSMGVASMIPTVNFSPRGLMLATDQALYQAKEDGRSCIRVNQFPDKLGEES